MKKYRNGKEIEMDQEEIEAFELSRQPTLEELKQARINVRQQYLESTDWYCLREIDEPSSYPSEIRSKRILARQEINEIEVADKTTINNYLAEY